MSFLLRSISPRVHPLVHHRLLFPPLVTVFVSPRAMSTTTPVAPPVGSAEGPSASSLIPFSSRLQEGRALALDVWSIYKYATSTMDVYPLAKSI
jgi:hypothetical protein